MSRGKPTKDATESSGSGPEVGSAPARASRQPLLLAVLLTSLAWLVLAGGALWLLRQPEPVAFQVQPAPATATPAPTPTPQPIQVEVTGAVLTPGVYQLPAGARVGDAIAAAGGLAPHADAAALNLAQALQDGEKLTAPTPAPSRPAAAASVADSAPDLGATRSGGIDLAGLTLIDINQASVQELDVLPSIGPVTAQAIVDYRTANGPFRAIEDLVNVKGIGPATLEKIRALITVGD